MNSFPLLLVSTATNCLLIAWLLSLYKYPQQHSSVDPLVDLDARTAACTLTSVPPGKDATVGVREEPEEVDSRHSFLYADRHIEDVFSIVNDPDCTSREFNVQSPDYKRGEAAAVLEKCRVIVLRNVFSESFILQQFKPAYTAYLNALQQRLLDPKHRVIYDPYSPTKRYEIMLPAAFASWDELIDNPRIAEILGLPQILDETYFLHSLGTVVTEPGAAHQGWHEEDNYLWDTISSWENFGIAGHDLPPYVINLFSPLLNLTHDHGPTEFCVGSSVTTGLLSWSDDKEFLVYDPELRRTLQENKTNAFSSLLEFHKGATGVTDAATPCPPANLRSVLLNVGDVVLFDYQIIHRAGHNNAMESNDTRAQIYLAYARKWFRDLNYEANRYDDNEKEDPSVFDPLTSQTRFAPGIDHETQNAMVTPVGVKKPIERLRNIIEQEPRDASHGNSKQRFVVTNLDIEPGTAFLLWYHQGNRVQQPLVAPGEHHAVEARSGSPLELLAADGRLLKRWKIPFDISQLVVSKQVAGIAGGSAKNQPVPLDGRGAGERRVDRVI